MQVSSIFSATCARTQEEENEAIAEEDMQGVTLPLTHPSFHPRHPSICLFPRLLCPLSLGIWRTCVCCEYGREPSLSKIKGDLDKDARAWKESERAYARRASAHTYSAARFYRITTRSKAKCIFLSPSLSLFQRLCVRKRML